MKVKILKNSNEILEMQKFRYEIFGRQCGYLDETDCPDGIDRDQFEDDSSHICATTDNGEIVGCCRATFRGSYVELFFEFPPLDFPREDWFEINRFGISPAYRRDKQLRFLMYQTLAILGLEKKLPYCLVTVHHSFYQILKADRCPINPIENFTRKKYSGYYSKYPEQNQVYLIDCRIFCERFSPD